MVVNHAWRENYIKSHYGIIILRSHVALPNDFSKDMLIFYSYSIEKSGILTFFAQF